MVNSKDGTRMTLEFSHSGRGGGTLEQIPTTFH